MCCAGRCFRDRRWMPSAAARAEIYIYRANDTGGVILWSCENEAVAQRRRRLLRPLGQVPPHHQRGSR